MIFYHITPTSRLPRIQNEGLRPETSLSSKEELEEHWLPLYLDYAAAVGIPSLTVLKITLPKGYLLVEADADPIDDDEFSEHISYRTIPPRLIKIHQTVRVTGKATRPAYQTGPFATRGEI